MQTLQIISLERTSVTDSGLRELTALKHLQELYLGGTKVTDTGLTKLPLFTNLRGLRVGGTTVSDAGAEACCQVEEPGDVGLGRYQSYRRWIEVSCCAHTPQVSRFLRNQGRGRRDETHHSVIEPARVTPSLNERERSWPEGADFPEKAPGSEYWEVKNYICRSEGADRNEVEKAIARGRRCYRCMAGRVVCVDRASDAALMVRHQSNTSSGEEVPKSRCRAARSSSRR